MNKRKILLAGKLALAASTTFVTVASPLNSLAIYAEEVSKKLAITSATAKSYGPSGDGNLIEHSLDGDPTTYTNSNYLDAALLPQEYYLGFGQTFNVDKVRIHPRQVGSGIGNGAPNRVEVYISTDGGNSYSTKVADQAIDPNLLGFTDISFEAVKADTVKLVLHSNHPNVVSTGEVEIWGSDIVEVPEDTVAPDIVDKQWSTREPTNDPVEVTIKFTEPISKLEERVNGKPTGHEWKKIDDVTYYREYTENANYYIYYEDLAGNACTKEEMLIVDNYFTDPIVGEVFFKDVLVDEGSHVEIELNAKPPKVFGTIKHQYVYENEKHVLKLDDEKLASNDYYDTICIWGNDTDKTETWSYIYRDEKGKLSAGLIERVEQPSVILTVGDKQYDLNENTAASDNLFVIPETAYVGVPVTVDVKAPYIDKCTVQLTQKGPSETAREQKISTNHQSATIELVSTQGETTSGIYSIMVEYNFSPSRTRYYDVKVNYEEKTEIVNKDALQKMYDEKKGLKPEYITNSPKIIENYNKAVERAETLLADNNATQEEVNKATEELENRYYSFVVEEFKYHYSPAQDNFDYNKYTTDSILPLLNAYYATGNYNPDQPTEDLKADFEAFEEAIKLVEKAPEEVRGGFVGLNPKAKDNMSKLSGEFIVSDKVVENEDGSETFTLHVEYKNNGKNVIKGTVGTPLELSDLEDASIYLEYELYSGESGRFSVSEYISNVTSEGFTMDIPLDGAGIFNLDMEAGNKEAHTIGSYYSNTYEIPVINVTTMIDGTEFSGETLEDAVSKSGITASNVESIEFVSGKITPEDLMYLKDKITYLETLKMNLNEDLVLVDADGNKSTVLPASTFKGTRLVHVELAGFTEIGASAFNEATKLESVSMPDVQIIKTKAFYRTDEFVDIKLPASIQKLEDCGFGVAKNGGKELTVTIEATTPPTITGSVFKNADAGSEIRIPKGTLSAYLPDLDLTKNFGTTGETKFGGLPVKDEAFAYVTLKGKNSYDKRYAYVEKGQSITEKQLEVTFKDGDKVITGWNTSEDGSGTVIDTSTQINDDMILYAQFGVPDTEKPVVQVTYSNNNGSQVTKEDVTVTLTANEAIQDIEGWTRENDTTLKKVFDKNGKYTVTVTDLARNTTNVKFEVKRIDKVEPVIEGINDGDVTNEAVTYKVVEQSISKIVVDGTEYNEKNAPYTITEEGKHTIQVIDKAGNDCTVTFTIDLSKPTAEVTYSEVVDGKQTVTITTDEAVKELDGWTKKDRSGNILTKTYDKDTEEVVYVEDLAGNKSEAINIKVKVSPEETPAEEKVAKLVVNYSLPGKGAAGNLVIKSETFESKTKGTPDKTYTFKEGESYTVDVPKGYKIVKTVKEVSYPEVEVNYGSSKTIEFYLEKEETQKPSKPEKPSDENKPADKDKETSKDKGTNTGVGVSTGIFAGLASISALGLGVLETLKRRKK